MVTNFWKYPETIFYELILVKLRFFSKKNWKKKQKIAKSKSSMKKIFFVFNKQWKKKTFDKKYTFIETGLEMEANNSEKKFQNCKKELNFLNLRYNLFFLFLLNTNSTLSKPTTLNCWDFTKIPENYCFVVTILKNRQIQKKIWKIDNLQ